MFGKKNGNKTVKNNNTTGKIKEAKENLVNAKTNPTNLKVQKPIQIKRQCTLDPLGVM